MDKFENISANANSSIEKISQQYKFFEKNIEKLENLVYNSNSETSEDTNLIVTNVLKKSAEIYNKVNETNIGIECVNSNSEILARSCSGNKISG
ncbi:MAG: hypothetical protein MZU97_01880 [Bacillus subtilis]|nr:hypothetical protein [Bacillus subtilis]